MPKASILSNAVTGGWRIISRMNRNESEPEVWWRMG